MINYEQQLLGACMQGGDVGAVAEIVNGRDFDAPVNEIVWNAILRTYSKGQTPNILTVIPEIPDITYLPLMNGVYLQELCASLDGTSESATWLAEQVVEQSVSRDIDSVQASLSQAKHEGLSVDERRRIAIERLEALERRERQSKYATPGETLARVVDVAERGISGAIPTRWPDLDHAVSGWFPGQLITIGARPGAGKSIFAENCATQAALKQDLPVYFASLEMSSFELTQRTVANLAEVNLQALRNASMSERDWDRVNHNSALVSELKVWHADAAQQTVADIRAGVKAMRRHFGKVGLVIVDYVQLLVGLDPRLTRQQQLGEATRALKRLARDEEVPVIILSQLRRSENPGKEPTMAELRESGDIENDSDVVILLHQPDPEDETKVLALVEKQRSGPKGVKVELVRRGWYARFDQPTQKWRSA